MTKPIVWSIAGTDSSGGAGIHVDLNTLADLGVQSFDIVTATTLQDDEQVHQIQAHSDQQMQEKIDSLPTPAAIKLGMLINIASIKHYLKSYQGFVVCDPVLTASSGKALTHPENIRPLFPYIDLLTPNIPETETLLGIKITDKKDIESAANTFIQSGIKSVLIKGGHRDDKNACDYWSDGTSSAWLSSPSIAKQARGTGCCLSSAIAACIGFGYKLLDAIVIAKMYINQAITHSNDNRLVHLGWPREQRYLPTLNQQQNTIHFPRIDKKIGLYPIVDSSEWIERLAPLGITTMQLRMKENSSEEEIIRSIVIAKKHNIQLFINDDWQLAIKHGAYGIHLGQSDLHTADIIAIAKAGCRLGISTHCFYEVARAYALSPSYIACGPIFHTNSKQMPFTPQGIPALQYWQQLLRNYPIVAIGGINKDNINDVKETGVDGIAMISAITEDKQPEIAVKQLLAMI